MMGQELLPGATVLLVPESHLDGCCVASTKALANILPAWGPLHTQICVIDSDYVDPRYSDVDTLLRQQASLYEGALDQGILVRTHPAPTSLGLHLIGIGSHTRPQYYSPSGLDGILESLGTLPIGALRNGLIPSGSIDEIKAIQSNLDQVSSEWLVSLGAYWLDRSWHEGAVNLLRKSASMIHPGATHLRLLARAHAAVGNREDAEEYEELASTADAEQPPS